MKTIVSSCVVLDKQLHKVQRNCLLGSRDVENCNFVVRAISPSSHVSFFKR